MMQLTPLFPTPWQRPRYARRHAAVVCLLCPLLLAAHGCNGSQVASSPSGTSAGSVTGDRVNEEVFVYAIGLLNSLDEFDSIGTVDDVVAWLSSDWSQETIDRLSVGGTLAETVDRLNQWAASQPPSSGWQADPLLNTLPPSLRDIVPLQTLGDLKFPRLDSIQLRQAVWLRDLSRQICGNRTSDLERASLLFDWTVRNIQLEPDVVRQQNPVEKELLPRLPWQTLLLGRGTAAERAWIFMLLARQQQLDVVMLAYPDADAEGALRQWTPALVLDNQLYLFEPALGFAIPGPGGKGVATLSQVLEDDSLLRRLDLDAEHPYPVSSSNLASIVALVEASPIYLSRRMALVSSRLAGEEKLVLSVEPSALAEHLKNIEHVAEVRLWELPYERLRQAEKLDQPERKQFAEELRPLLLPFLQPRKQLPDEPLPAALWRGRSLHLSGKFGGTDGANHFYQLVRVADSELERHAAGFERATQFPREQFVELARTAKVTASYWLGLVAFERQNYAAAIDYLQTRTLEAFSGSNWTTGARYNLARSYEALGQPEQAIRAYRAGQSPQRHGNLLRARWLEQSVSGEAAGKEGDGGEAGE